MQLHRPFSTREYVLGGIFSLLAAFPLVSATSLSVPLEARLTNSDIQRAFDDRANQSHLRRMRWSVLRDCAQREANGEENVCPDSNDEQALMDYWTPAVREAAADDRPMKAAMEDLTGYERNVLRRAIRNGQCPTDLDTLTPGFQALCDHEVTKPNERVDAIKEAAEKWMGRPRR